jgi:hypothetical protein
MGRRMMMLAAALAIVAGCGGSGRSVADCWEEAVNRPAAAGGCQGIADPDALNGCLTYWDHACQDQTG